MTEPDATLRAMRKAIELKVQFPDANFGVWLGLAEVAKEHSIGYEFFEGLIAAGYSEFWDISRMPIPWQNVMRDQVSGMGYGAWCDTEPPRRAEALGHEVEADGPYGFTSASRWTCVDYRCGRAVIRYGDNVYGSAVEEICPGVTKLLAEN